MRHVYPGRRRLPLPGLLDERPVRRPPLATTPDAGPRVALFTTYKLRTGSQFPKMRAALAGKTGAPRLELQSRNGRLSPADEKALEKFVS
jgi:hypothetical protein